MAHDDPRGRLAPHVRRQVAALAESVDDLVVVSTADLTVPAEEFLRRHARLVRRPDYGQGFFSYKTGLDLSGDLTRYDEVVICNDTCVGPLQSYPDLFARMAPEPVDFWGLTSSRRISPHVQGFFVAFRPWLTGSRTFQALWAGMKPISKRGRVIRSHEVGLSSRLTEAGFRWSTVFRETPEDERLARRRVAWWVAHRAPLHLDRDTLHRLDEGRQQWWDPAIGLADAALDAGRLPYVQIDTLRHDPYALNAARLLTLCEETYPDAFDGVRAYLRATTAAHRAGRLRPTPTALKPLRPLVEYRRAS